MSMSQKNIREQAIEKYFFLASAVDFKKISGNPIAYWAGRSIFSAFESTKSVSSITTLHRGISTGNTDLFARVWHEVSAERLNVKASSRAAARSSGARWFPYNRGGIFRKWYGLGTDIIDYQNDGHRMAQAAEIGESPGFRHDGAAEYFLPTVTWTALTAGKPSFRLLDAGYVLGHKGSSIKSPEEVRLAMLALLNSNVLERFLEYISPTLDINISQISCLPLPEDFGLIQAGGVASKLVQISKSDWDSYETSWDFSGLPLLRPDLREPTLKYSYQKLRAHWRAMTLEMQRFEQENNRIAINAYGLQDDLDETVNLSEITLTCNPSYRYGGDRSEEELETMLLTDTMRELVSYAVGCMFGRYSIDKQGLILANQGESLADYLTQVPQPSFPADDDNVIPVLDGDWFADDITLRFRQFLRVAFGDEHYEDNLAFIEQALNLKGKRSYTLRDYFLSEFYADHVKRYKKRPIYWLFSSPKGSFNALIYMHRYRPDTVSVVLKYLRDYRDKLVDERNRQTAVTLNPASSQGDKTRAQKEVDRLGKVLAELEDYERDVLYPLATEQKPIDLDDGVKKNYLAFGAALKKIPGLEAKEED
jgi:hypothetical protein